MMRAAIHISKDMNMQMFDWMIMATVSRSIGRMNANSKIIQFLDSFIFTVPLASE